MVLSPECAHSSCWQSQRAPLRLGAGFPTESYTVGRQQQVEGAKKHLAVARSAGAETAPPQGAEEPERVACEPRPPRAHL